MPPSALIVTFEQLLDAMRREYHEPEATRLTIEVWERLDPNAVDRTELNAIAERTP